MAGEWRPYYVSDTLDDDSSKDFVAPGELQLLSIRVYLTTEDTAGNRILTIRLYDDSDGNHVIDEVRAGLVQAASTDWHYHIAPGATRLTTIYDSDFLSFPIPNWILRRGQMIRVLDGAAVAIGADTNDDMEVFITGMVKGALWGDTQVKQDWPSA